VGSGVKGAWQGGVNATKSAAEKFPGDTLLSKTAKAATVGLGAVTSGILGSGRAAINEIATDLGSPSYRGSRVQRFFEGIAEKTKPQNSSVDRTMESAADLGKPVSDSNTSAAGNSGTSSSSKGSEN
jgi:hypothetical protein